VEGSIEEKSLRDPVTEGSHRRRNSSADWYVAVLPIRKLATRSDLSKGRSLITKITKLQSCAGGENGLRACVCGG